MGKRRRGRKREGKRRTHEDIDKQTKREKKGVG